MVDRRRDATDLFTATVGYGAGMKARVGPLQAGLLVDVTGVGVRSGDLLGPSDFWPEGYDTPGSWDIAATLFNVEACSGGKTAMQRGKAYSFITHSPLVYPQNPYRMREDDSPHSFASRTQWLNENKYRHAPASFYTQIELAVALGPAVRLGFNPGELLDFILGWTTIDIFGDDLAH